MWLQERQCTLCIAADITDTGSGHLITGILIARSDLDKRPSKVRRDTRSARSGRDVYMLLALTFEIYQARLLRFTDNAEKTFKGLNESSALMTTGLRYHFIHLS
ncbi:uncharacterized protein BO96DRAFT_422693 [Aspergillus niger CBS 101883]|uniref:uncharacterized protein n=1 Tax=Aspergillus lacticoffeatus (strain CBS 101883) TaxID=1450533 RepID=UPI000D803EF9|nr:uncharacterized protein BO96DRAFT_422693 [Aspergillus niger CBS 101883]PYH57015.1 hypothetical protein BO96DRAFT_422693 [Aspergillus niger CBS 101883]